MDKYTLYCTEQQTKRALELGAPIHQTPMLEILRNEIGERCFLSDNYSLCWFPTTAQMIGWLEEKGIYITTLKGYDYWKFSISTDLIYIKILKNNSHKEGTIAAIDAALDYLSNQKGKI